MEEAIPLAEKIYTNRLQLRKLEYDDLETLLNWSSRTDAYGDFLSPEILHKEELMQKYATGLFWNHGEKLFLITKRDGWAIGTIHYWIPADKLDTAIAAVKIAEPIERNNGFIETLTYDDRGIRRTGNLYRINGSQYSHQPIYRYHYE